MDRFTEHLEEDHYYIGADKHLFFNPLMLTVTKI